MPEAEPPRPAAEARRREQVDLLGRRQVAQRDAEQPAHELVADVLERPDALLLAAAEQRVDDLEQQVFEEVGVLLVDAGRDEQLPRPAAAVLDRVQQVRLARPPCCRGPGTTSRVRRRVVAVQVDDARGAGRARRRTARGRGSGRRPRRPGCGRSSCGTGLPARFRIVAGAVGEWSIRRRRRTLANLPVQPR